MAQDPYKYFRIEARDLLDRLGRGLLDLERGSDSDGAEMLRLILRIAHTLKGAARVVKQPGIADRAHAIEDALAPFRDTDGGVPRETVNTVLTLVDEIANGVAALSPEDQAAPAREKTASPGKPAPEEFVRTIGAEIEEIDTLLNGVTEAFARLNGLRRAGESIERARHLSELIVGQLSSRGERGEARPALARADRVYAMAEELRGIVSGLERHLGSAHERMARELHQVRDTAEQLRLVPAGVLFTALERTARDAAHALDKEVTFVGSGGDVRLDAHVLRIAQEALTQIVRNAVAHGIEPPADRITAGKPPAGSVTLAVIRRGRRVVFRCADDGQGFDLEAVRAAAQRRGVAREELGRLDAEGLMQLLLRGGISTSAAVTEVSGRGVGLDVVRAAAERLGGTVAVNTTLGGGSVFELNVPLSLASMESLLVECERSTMTIPLDAVRHTQRIGPGDVSRGPNGDSIVFNGTVIPFVHLRKLIHGGASAPGRERDISAVVVAADGDFAAVGVDRLVGTGNVVLRALPELAPTAPVVAGASFDAEGNPQLVLDPEGIVGEALREAAPEAEAQSAKVPVLVIDDSLTTRMLEQSILESAGYEVDVATSAEEALEVARQRQYRLFLVDVEMPGMDGFGFIEHIRADPALRDIPAILVTSRASPEDFQRGEDVGAQGYMVKSEFDQAQLLSRIRQLAG